MRMHTQFSLWPEKQTILIIYMYIQVILQVSYHRTSEALDLTRLTGCNRVCLTHGVPGSDISMARKARVKS